MEEPTKQPTTEDKLNFERPDETLMSVGDIQLHTCEGLETTYQYVLKLLGNKIVRDYLEKIEVTKLKEKAGYLG